MRGYLPGSGVYMLFHAPYVPGILSWFQIKVYQDDFSNVLVRGSVSVSGGMQGGCDSEAGFV